MKTIKELEVRFCITCERYSLSNHNKCSNCLNNNRKGNLITIPFLKKEDVLGLIDEITKPKFTCIPICRDLIKELKAKIEG